SERCAAVPRHLKFIHPIPSERFGGPSFGHISTRTRARDTGTGISGAWLRAHRHFLLGRTSLSIRGGEHPALPFFLAVVGIPVSASQSEILIYPTLSRSTSRLTKPSTYGVNTRTGVDDNDYQCARI